jgi:hypothetical protein
VIGLATVSGAEEGIKLEIDDDKVHGVQDTVEDGAHVILNRYDLNHPEHLYFSGDEKIIRPIASDWAASSRE